MGIVTLWYLSFCSDKGFLGATVVEARDAESAHGVATMRGLNPGGEVLMLPVPPERESSHDVRAMFNKLLDKAQMTALGGVRVGDLSPIQREWFNHATSCMCEHCNKQKSQRQ